MLNLLNLLLLTELDLLNLLNKLFLLTSSFQAKLLCEHRFERLCCFGELSMRISLGVLEFVFVRL